MKTCANCKENFPIIQIINNKKRNLCKRKYCIKCSPFGTHNTRQLNKTLKCIICSHKLVGNQTTYCSRSCMMKKGGRWYQQQKIRGIKRKIDFINLLGGKCSKCGYNKNLAALDFHHLNPEQKETPLNFGFLLKMKYEKCLKEVKKCIILCANCHREHHNSIYNNWNTPTWS